MLHIKPVAHLVPYHTSAWELFHKAFLLRVANYFAMAGKRMLFSITKVFKKYLKQI